VIDLGLTHAVNGVNQVDSKIDTPEISIWDEISKGIFYIDEPNINQLTFWSKSFKYMKLST